MKLIRYPEKSLWQELLIRPFINNRESRVIVKPIIKKVKDKGDKALRKFTFEYDHVELDQILVSQAEFENARKIVKKDLKKAIKTAYDNIEKFHAAQRRPTLNMETTPGVHCTKVSIPIESVGLYIPGGSAPLFSSILMLGIPAKIAGCKKIVMCTPCHHSGNIDPVMLYTAEMVGIEMIAKIGGAQAIAAMAYGTESVPKVDKIFGPGNQFVTTAKSLVNQTGTAIDMPAGPSELMVIGDDTAIPEFVAADLLSQAEHGIDSQVILVSTSEELITAVKKEINVQAKDLPRKHIVSKALDSCRLILVNTIEEAVEFANLYAPEHLIIAAANDEIIVEGIKNAGSIFLGNFTPESAGDYASGTNHTLPTYGYARVYSGITLDSFMKTITIQKISKQGILNLGPTIESLARAEKLDAHKKSISIRLKKIQNDEKT